MRPRASQPPANKSLPKTDYAITHNDGKAQGVTAFLAQHPRSTGFSSSIGQGSTGDTSALPGELLLPDSAWQPGHDGTQTTGEQNEAPPSRSRGLSRTLTFSRKPKASTSNSPERKKGPSIELSRPDGTTSDAHEVPKSKRFSLLRSRSKEGPLYNSATPSSTLDVKPPSKSKGSLGSFFGVSESTARVPSTPKELRSKSSSLSSLGGSRNDSLQSLGEPAVMLPPTGSSGDRSRTSASVSRKKDELASIIKVLESDYNK